MFRLIKSLFAPSLSPKELRISIEELSPLWLKYNQSFIQLPTEPTEQTQPAEATQPVEAVIQPIEAVPPSKTPTPFISARSGSSSFAQDAISEFFDPHRSLFDTQGAKEGFIAILELLDQHGNCPSIVTITPEKDSESDEIMSVKQFLEKVTLREHSANVARIMLKLIKKTYKDYENLIPMALVVSFAHDLGKLPVLRGSGAYAKADHPLISAQKLGEIFSQKEPSWLKTAVDCVKNHHRPSNNSFNLLFREADSMAREMEIGLHSKDLKPMEWNQWFDVKQFLNLLKIDINVIQTGNRWKAFSFGSLVYCQPDFLYESAKKLASEKKVIDMKLHKTSSKEEAIKKIVESLRNAGALSDDIGESYFGRPYEIQADRFKKKMFLVPLKIEAFGVPPHEIERQKEGYLELIRAVVPVKK